MPRDPEVGETVRIRKNWDREGTLGVVLGRPIWVKNEHWTPMMFADEETPTFHKMHGLESLECGECGRLIKSEMYEHDADENIICTKCARNLRA